MVNLYISKEERRDFKKEIRERLKLIKGGYTKSFYGTRYGSKGGYCRELSEEDKKNILYKNYNENLLNVFLKLKEEKASAKEINKIIDEILKQKKIFERHEEFKKIKRDFIGRQTNLGRIQEIFILENDLKQFLINDNYYCENVVSPKNLFLVRKYTRDFNEKNPNLFELWAIKRTFEDFYNLRIDFKKQSEFSCKYFRKKHRNSMGKPYNFTKLIHDVEFRIKQSIENGFFSKEDFREYIERKTLKIS
ncbi:hypothetical protein H2274_07155 [Campylobacter sp. W0049]|uniref:hypothetical protein n=1 Tax=Campylobacter molothri TaxID=1032242 RepID=UPI00301B87F0|nr:hypothetical protein [Campylobacter sp. W0049]